jgi:hypothetical protein
MEKDEGVWMRIGTPKLSPEAREKLSALFARVPRAFLVNLAAAVAADRAAGGTGLPHDTLLSLLNAQLRRADEEREEERKDTESVLRTAPREIAAALPFSSFGGFGATAAPLDFSQPPDPDRLRHAAERVSLLIGLDRIAALHGLEKELFAVRAEVASLVRVLKKELMRELRAPRFAAEAEAYRGPVLRLSRDILAEWELGELEQAPRAA